MIVKCLTSNEVRALLAHLVDRQHGIDKGLAESIDAAKSWCLSLICHNLFIARDVDVGQRGLTKIDYVYTARDEMALEIEEGGDLYVEFLLRNIREDGATLEDVLISVQEGFADHNYGKTLRY